jgi:hypothetical protein
VVKALSNGKPMAGSAISLMSAAGFSGTVGSFKVADALMMSDKSRAGRNALAKLADGKGPY